MFASGTTKTDKDSTHSNTLMVEGEIAEDDQEWQLAQQAVLATPAPVQSGGQNWWQRWWQNWWMTMAIVFSCLIVMGSVLWYQAQAGLSQIESELQAAIEANSWRETSNSGVKFTRTGVIQELASSQPLPSEARFQLLDLGKEWAIVNVTTTQGELDYRQTRLFRRAANGWYATEPSAALWGRPQVLETTDFVFHYYALDAEAVAEAATKLDAIYPGLAASYPHAPSPDGKRQIWVSPEYSLAGPLHRTATTALEIASPGVYLSPAEISEGDILAQAVLLAMLDVLVDESLDNPLLTDSYDVRARARVLLQGLRLWQLWRTGLPLATLHKPTVQWILHKPIDGRLYSNGSVSRPTPESNARLCALHQLWQDAPPAMQIPLFCGDAQQLVHDEVGRYLPVAAPGSLAAIYLFAPVLPDEPARGVGEAAMVSLATLFDYVATTYGQQSLVALMTNAAVASSWDALIHTTFDVSRSDFETGWQTYLHNHYEISTASKPNSPSIP